MSGRQSKEDDVSNASYPPVPEKPSTSNVNAPSNPPRTPSRKSPTKQQPQQVGITQAQKQALIDNLQLEITERARKLRANYAEQAQHLRSRLELRINRIPMAMRKRKIGDLMREQEERERWEQEAADTRAEQSKVESSAKTETAVKDFGVRKSLKRPSDRISTDLDDDKENQGPQDPSSPKKRVKTIPTPVAANTKAIRAVPPRETEPVAPAYHVLSPQSHRSRSPSKMAITAINPASRTTTTPTDKAQQSSRIPSPSKALPPVPPNAAANAKSSGLLRQPSRSQPQPPKTQTQTRQNAANAEKEPRLSDASNTSASTTTTTSTVGRKGRPPAAAAAAAKGKTGTKAATAKTGIASKVATAMKKTAAPTKKENAAPTLATAASGRSLRKRN